MRSLHNTHVTICYSVLLGYFWMDLIHFLYTILPQYRRNIERLLGLLYTIKAQNTKENIERLLQSREAFMRQYEACDDLNICPFFWAVVTAKLNLLDCILSV